MHHSVILITTSIIVLVVAFFIMFIDIRTIERSYFAYIITISLKKIRKIALDQVATFSLQPAADVCRARLQQRG